MKWYRMEEGLVGTVDAIEDPDGEWMKREDYQRERKSAIKGFMSTLDHMKYKIDMELTHYKCELDDLEPLG